MSLLVFNPLDELRSRSECKDIPELMCIVVVVEVGRWNGPPEPRQFKAPRPETLPHSNIPLFFAKEGIFLCR